MVKEKVSIEGITITIYRKNIKNMYLRVLPPNGEVKVSAPLFVSDSEIVEFIHLRKDWILEKQKLTEGKELIRYFCAPCAPTKANGGRTRNFPFHAHDKWAQFKADNLRDVEVEITIRQRLSKFPVSSAIWEEYRIDQEINDRGIEVDMDLVEQALRLDALSREKLTAAMKHMTEMENR